MSLKFGVIVFFCQSATLAESFKLHLHLVWGIPKLAASLCHAAIFD